MKFKVDLLREVVLLIGPTHQVVDAFAAEGITIHECSAPVSFYTYRSLLTLPFHCLVCGRSADAQKEACPSSGGFHAFVGLEPDFQIDPGHRAENRSAPFLTLQFEDLQFFLESDHLFPAEEIMEVLSV